LRIASLETQKAAQTVREAWGTLLPSVSAEGTYTRYAKLPVFFFPTISIDPSTGAFDFAEPSTPIEMGAKNTYAGSVSIGVPLYRADLYAGIRVANAQEQMARADERWGKADIVASVRKMYVQILLLREQKTVAEESMARTQGLLIEARHLFQQGLVTEVDTLHAYVMLENQRPVLTKLENAVRSSISILRNLIGVSADEQIVLTDSLLYVPAEQTMHDSADLAAFVTRPDLEKLSYQVRAAEALKDAEFAGHLPSLAFFGQVQVQEEQNDFNFSKYNWPTISMVGLRLSVPLFSGFQTDARVQQAELVRLQAETQFTQAKDAARTEIQIALGDREEAERRLGSSQVAVLAAERSYQKTRSRWQQGLCKQIEVADANVMLSQARLDRLQAVADCLIADLELQRAIGVPGR
jgi:outer membrane protein TolC